MAVDPLDDRLDSYQQVARDEAQEHSSVFGTFLAGLGAIAVGAAIYRGRTGQNMVADMLHWAQYGRGTGLGFGKTLKNMANAVEDGGESALSAGRRSVADGQIDLRDRSLRLDRPDIIRDFAYMLDLQTSTSNSHLRGELTEQLIQHTNARLKIPTKLGFWKHDLEHVTMGNVLDDTTGLWMNRLGGTDFEILKQARKRGWVSSEHMLDPNVYRYKTGSKQVRDLRFATSRTIDQFFTVIDPFGQGKVIRSMLDRGPKVGVLPEQAPGEGLQYFVGDKLFLYGRARPEGIRPPRRTGRRIPETGFVTGLHEIASGLKLSLAGDPLSIVRSLREGPGRVGRGRVADPEGQGFLARAQRATGIGPAYANRRSLFQLAITDPLKRARGIVSGDFQVFARPGKYAGESFLKETPVGVIFPEMAIGYHKKIVEGGAPSALRGKGLTRGQFHGTEDIAPGARLGAWDRTKILFGAHTDYEVAQATSLRRTSRIRPGDVKLPLTDKDKAIRMSQGGVENVDLSFRAGDPQFGSKFAEASLTGLGERSLGQRAKYYATPKGVMAGGTDFANYMFARLNSLASSFGVGIGFKISGRPWQNAARLGAIPVAYRAGVEAIGYADFMVEDITGVSPIKMLGKAYATLRVGQQKLRELSGLRAVAGGLEQAYPGLVESEGMTLLRSLLLPGAIFLRGLRRGFKPAALRAGLAYAAVGGTGLSQPSEELAAEYAGERKVPVRQGSFWGLGYQPFFGGDISHFDHSWHHKLQTDARTKSTYGSRAEYYGKYSNVFGIPFPTIHSGFGIRQILDPYALERKHYYDRPYSETGGRFDEMPIIGPILSELDALVPFIGKPRKRMHVGELMGIPTQGATLSDRTIPASAATRLGITDIQAAGIVYEDASDPLVRLREQAAIATEPLGVYKFAMQFFGLDLSGTRESQMAKASSIGSFTREFYDSGIGGLFGQTEFPRRFLLSEFGLASKQRQLFNPLRNTMPTWLPGVGSESRGDEDYFLDFLHGDPYARLEEGESRLPGVGYEALNAMHSGTSGFYDEVDKLMILSDVAPYSMAFQQARQKVEGMDLSSEWQQKVDMALAQRDVVVNQLSAYSRYNENADSLAVLNENIHGDAAMAQMLGVGGLQRTWDTLSHDFLAEIPYFGSKLFPFRDPLERYEKEQIYGDTFADWNRPWETIGRPAMYDVARSSPVAAAAKGAFMGWLMSMPYGQLLNPIAPLRGAGAIPIMAGAATAASLGRAAVTDPNFIPPHKRKEIEAMEYMDMMQYTKARSYQLLAEERGDPGLAAGFGQLANKTFVGAKSYQDIRSAMGSMDRQYLNAFLDAPEEDRGRMMSSLPTYYMDAIDRIRDNDFESTAENDTKALQYFKDHAAVPENSLLWHPSVPTTAMKVKMVQGGINGVSDNLHRFGFYESQGIEASLRFPDVHYQKPAFLNLPNFDSMKNRLLHELRRSNPFDPHPDRTSIRKIHNSFRDSQMTFDQTIDRRDQTYFYMSDLMRQ